jgi:hypothetical protein
VFDVGDIVRVKSVGKVGEVVDTEQIDSVIYVYVLLDGEEKQFEENDVVLVYGELINFGKEEADAKRFNKGKDFFTERVWRG